MYSGKIAVPPGGGGIVNNYNNSSFYIIYHNDSHRICPSSIQQSEGSTLGPPLPVKTCKHRFLNKLQLFSADSFYNLHFVFKKEVRLLNLYHLLLYIKTTNSLLKNLLPGDVNVLKYKQCSYSSTLNITTTLMLLLYF
jgi:hypothetical protein